MVTVLPVRRKMRRIMMMLILTSSIMKKMILIAAATSVYNLDGLEHDTFYHARARFSHILVQQ